MQPKALDDIKVVELPGFVSGPYCGKLLADLGAEVIKVEPPTGDRTRRAGPFPQDAPHQERSGLFLYLNTNKLGVTLDLTTATGRDILRKLAAEADVVVETYPPGWLESHGLGYDDLRAVNPRLILTSITPFGQTGPYKDYKGTDLIIQHLGGFGLGVPGRVEDPSMPPLRAAVRQADYLSGIIGAMSTLHALFARDKDGIGSHVDVSSQDAVASMVFGNVGAYEYEGKMPPRLKSDGSPIGTVLMASCKDGMFCFVIGQERMWKDWVEVMGNPAWAFEDRFKDRVARLKNFEAFEQAVSGWAQQHTKDEIYRMAQAKRIPITPVNTMAEVLHSPQIASSDYLEEVVHPVAGPVTLPGAPYKLTETPWRVDRPAPTLGQHNEDAYCRRLGFSREELVKLREAAVI
ncbi:MAG: CoA transferase [Chloroflexi bacterium]|nr:CoA transferase [Chloroflexota bacterium]